jgi:hypothetical protein
VQHFVDTQLIDTVVREVSGHRAVLFAVICLVDGGPDVSGQQPGFSRRIALIDRIDDDAVTFSTHSRLLKLPCRRPLDSVVVLSTRSHGLSWSLVMSLWSHVVRAATNWASVWSGLFFTSVAALVA